MYIERERRVAHIKSLAVILYLFAEFAMNKRTGNVLAAILIFGFCIGLVAYGFWAKRKLENRHQLTVALTQKVTGGGLGNAGRLFLDYTLEVKGKLYKGSNVFLTNELNWNDAEQYFIKKTFPSVYNPDNPSISLMLITPKDFSRFGYKFPDSLNWVKSFIKQ